ncbi:ABC transporter ATP-binding protein [Streptomyces brasiliensis]|uniref:ABC transporter ATP-binding protein n=1 Tax=Streptomyces brasiliensis TaxID=1954 RepID=UPI0016711DBF|nr:ABC transporter ATP-binding protein [Streptomyces brasiliensis]
MIQAFGLTSNPRKVQRPALEDVSFEARAGHVTALLGAPGAGKTTALKLMLELQQGRGITYFRGRPLNRISHPSREIGVVLGDVPGHPARSVRSHLRMLSAAAGVGVRRADEVLEVVGLVSLREERLGTLSRGMDRRLGLACALLPDPHTLVLDDPARGLSAAEARWLHGMLRAHAAQGATVLFTTADPKEAARAADRVVTLDQGRLVADQEAKEFARTRLRPRVAVRTPYAARLAALLTKEARTAQRSLEVVREDGNRLSVYGSTTADIGEAAFRHGILVHQLADEVGDMGPGAGSVPSDGQRPDPEAAMSDQRHASGESAATDRRHTADEHEPQSAEPSRTIDSPQPTDPPRTTDGPLADNVPAPAAQLRGAFPSQGQRPRAAVRTVGVPAPGDGRESAEAGPLPSPSPASASDTVVEDGTSPFLTAGSPAASTRGARVVRRRRTSGAQPQVGPARAEGSLTPGDTSPLPPPISVRPAPSPLRPLRYEFRRATGIGTGFFICGAVVAVSALAAVLLAGIGHTPQARLFAAWPREVPLPPAALGAGLLGALAFGDEFRHPALAVDRGSVPRRLGLLTAKLLLSGATALMLGFLTLGCDAEVLYVVYGRELAQVPTDWLSLSASWFGLVIGCAWAGVLAAGVFRSTSGGLATVVAVPVVVVPLVHEVLQGRQVSMAAGLPMRMREVFLLQWPFGGERYLVAVARVLAQPVGGALTLSLAALLCAYLLTTLRSRVR